MVQRLILHFLSLTDLSSIYVSQHKTPTASDAIDPYASNCGGLLISPWLFQRQPEPLLFVPMVAR